MCNRRLASLCLSIILLTTAGARAGEPNAEAPTIVVRVQSLNVLLDNLALVVKLVGQEDAANQIEGLIKGKIGKKGLEGVDPTRPLGAYARFGKEIDDIKGAILIPIADKDTFLRLLANQNVEITKDKDDIYTYKTNKNFSLYFRFANSYLYVTSVNTDSIRDTNLPDPVKALTVTGNATIALVARLDQIPDGAKLIALSELEKVIETAQKQAQPNETKIQEEFRLALLREVHKFGSSLIREAGELRVDLDVNDKSKELMFNLALDAKPGSELAKTIKTIGSQQSPLAELVKKEAAFQGAVHFAWPEALNKAFAALIDEVSEKSVDGIQDAAKKKQAETLFKAMLPTAKAGEMQFVVAALGPKDGHYSFITGLKLKDGANLGKTVHALLSEAIKDIPAELRDKIRLDFDSVGAVKIHNFELPKDANLDKLLEDTVGDRQLYLAFRDDALFLALGKDALPTLKAAIAKKGSAASRPLLFDFDAARMVPVLAQTPEQKDLAARLFADGESGRVRVTIEGGVSLSVRVQIRLSVVEFLVKLKK